MNAPSRILADPIGTFMPTCNDEERKLRTRLLKARDLATSRVPWLKSEHAITVNWVLLETVSAWLYAPATIEDLQDVTNHCLRLFMCVEAAERIEGAR